MQQGAGGISTKNIITNNENIKLRKDDKIKIENVNAQQRFRNRQKCIKQQQGLLQKQRQPFGDICNVIQSSNVNKTERGLNKRQHNDQEIKYAKKIKINDKVINVAEAIKTNKIKRDGCPKVEQNQQENLLKIIDKNKDEDELDEHELPATERLFYLNQYSKDIYIYLRKLEFVDQIGINHLDGLEIDGKRRSIVVDWMIEVNLHFGLCQDTLELSIYLLDKYSELRKTINKRNAQLIAVVSIFVAAKYEEIDNLDMCDLIVVTDSAFKRKDIIRLERLMLSTVHFNLSRPSPVHFVRRYSLIAKLSPIEQSWAMYFCDAAKLEYTLCSVLPSLLAAAVVFLALCVSKEKVDIELWTDKLVTVSTYQIKDFFHILPNIAGALLICISSKLEAIKKKYSTQDRFYVTSTPAANPLIKGSVIQYFCQ